MTKEIQLFRKNAINIGYKAFSHT